jgi:broad specificity phosphatase PhoE
MRTVTLFLLRHGQKSGDTNTAFGLEQLAATANAHLASVTLSAVYCSDMKRTMQAAEHILVTRANPADATEIVKHPAFFVSHLSSPEHMEESVCIDRLLGEHGSTNDWQTNWKEAPSITEGIVTAMKEMAELASDGGTVLVCNHSPLCGLAALDDMAPIGLADVVKYTMVDDGSGWRIESSTLLPCPLKVPTP